MLEGIIEGKKNICVCGKMSGGLVKAEKSKELKDIIKDLGKDMGGVFEVNGCSVVDALGKMESILKSSIEGMVDVKRDIAENICRIVCFKDSGDGVEVKEDAVIKGITSDGGYVLSYKVL